MDATRLDGRSTSRPTIVRRSPASTPPSSMAARQTVCVQTCASKHAAAGLIEALCGRACAITRRFASTAPPRSLSSTATCSLLRSLSTHRVQRRASPPSASSILASSDTAARQPVSSAAYISVVSIGYQCYSEGARRQRPRRSPSAGVSIAAARSCLPSLRVETTWATLDIIWVTCSAFGILSTTCS